MSALSIQVPFPVFQDRDGQPLDNGYVWIGVANLQPQTNPLVAYFDEALTIIAAQPLRTINGYISNAGTPAQIYVNGVNYSILVQDSKGSMVYNFPDGTGIDPTLDSCSVTYDPTFTGGVPYPVCQKLAQTVSVQDFGAVGDGVTDDSVAFQAAMTFLASQDYASLYIPSGVYRLATRASATFSAGSYSIYGDGASSIIVGDNAVGALRMVCTSRHVYTTITDLNFSPALLNSGTGFEYTAPEGGIGQRNVFRMENCVFESYIPTLDASWFNVIVVTGVNRPSFNNVVAWRESLLKADTILNINGCYNPIITDCYFNGFATYGITNVRAATNEGFLLSNTIINGPDTGCYISQPNRHPLIWVNDSHFNCFVAGVHIVNSKFIWLCRNLMYSRAADGATYNDYLLDDCNSVNIIDNVYRLGTALNRRHVNLINGSRFIKISENGLNANTVIAPYYVDSTCQQVDLYLPPYSGNYDFASYPDVLYEFDSSLNVFYHTLNEVAAQNNGATQSILMRLHKNSDSPADGDTLGNLIWSGNDSAGNKVTFAQIVADATAVATGTHDGDLLFYSVQNAVAALQLRMGDGLSTGLAPRGQNTFTAGGGTGSLFFGLGTVRGIYGGAGAPEGVVTASPGSMYLNQSGGGGTTLYIKESGTGNTGWVAK
jgi:hypothetical protein